MDTNPTQRPFPIPVVAFGPGSQDEDDGLDYPVLPSGMDTYRPPPLPEPEAIGAHAGVLRVLHEVLAAVQAWRRGEPVAPVALDGLDADALKLLHPLLGEGEVSAQVLAEPGRRDPGGAFARVAVQESVFAGVWRVVEIGDDGRARDRLEVGRLPGVLTRAAAEDAASARPARSALPPQVVNVPQILDELADRRAAWREGDLPHVVNLTLLPLSPADIGLIDHHLGTGRVLVLSRGYGNCRITNTLAARTWRVVYYNSQDAVILNAIEVTDVPDVACAATEDLADTEQRLAEVLQWMAPS